jgi:ATP:cob(I)alamin adenosyltransferase
MSIYTRNGDNGKTSLLNGEKVYKDDIRIKLLGSLDELASNLGVIRSTIDDFEIESELLDIQNKLMIIMAYIADGNSTSRKIEADMAGELETYIDKYMINLPVSNNFIIPGEEKVSALIHTARAIARRAEINLTQVYREYPTASLTSSLAESATATASRAVKSYMNRLSDYLYSIARYIEFKHTLADKITLLVEEELSGKLDFVKQGSVKKLTLDMAKKLMEKVEDKAREMKLAAVVAVADASGNIIAVHFMDNAYPISYDVATKKAYTSAAIKMSTKKLAELAQPGCEFYGIQNSNEKVIVFGGGVPLKNGSEVLGGLGVSGGSVEDDSKLADYGAEVFEKEIGNV